MGGIVWNEWARLMCLTSAFGKSLFVSTLSKHMLIEPETSSATPKKKEE
jgi:hypothetical protein